MRLFKRKEETVAEVDDILLRALIGGQDITRTEAMSIPSVEKCVDLICNIFAMIPFKLYEETELDGKRVTKEVNDYRVRLINDDTGDTLDGFQFKKALCEDYLLGKGGYAYIKRDGTKFTSLYYIKDNQIAVEKNANPIFKSYHFLVYGKMYHDFELLKLLRNTKDGATGIGLVKEISTALRTGYRRLLYEYDLTVTGGSRKGFIKSTKKLSKEAMDALKKAWMDYYAGNANTVILNEGLDFKEASNTSRENELALKEKNFAAEVMDIFHISAKYEDTIKTAIEPIATAFVTALNRDLLLEREKGSFYFAADTRELYKGSLKERYEAYKIAIQSGFKTRNEIRYMEDDDAIPGLDVISFGLNDVLLDAKTGEMYTPNTNKTFKMSNKGGENIEN